MNRLQRISEETVRLASLDYVRPLYDKIAWDSPLTALLGTRGVGKTTLLLQRLKRLGLPSRQALYVDLGDIHFQQNRLFEFIEEFVATGGWYLLLDEVHRYGFGTWAQEIKQAYDVYRSKLTIVFTGSSAIRILEQEADLSRRALQFRVPGLSFREYLALATATDLPVLSYRDILQRHEELLGDLLSDASFRPLEHFATYNQEGYYPLFLTERTGYASRLNVIVQSVLQADIPAVVKQGQVNYQQIGRLLYAIASSVPFTPNISKLAARLQMSRDTLLHYLQLLERADLINSLRQESKGVAALGKPDKIYLNNPNLLFALAPTQWTVGTLRETFLLNQLNYLRYEGHFLPPEIKLPKQGDFVLLDKEDRYVFEVGGANKSSKQIGVQAGHYTVVDVERTANPHRIPLWLFGLLY